MSLQDKVPVAPIAPERLERLERRIVMAAGPVLARPRRPSFWPVGLALAGAAAGAIAMYALRPAPLAPATPPIAVTTDGARGASLALGDASIVAAPDTRYDVVRAGGEIDVRLDHGAVTLDVAPRRDRPPLWVHAGDVGVRVVGTAFTVTRAPAGDVSVEVEHGTVEVHRAGTIAPVTGGQRWSSHDGSVLAIAPTTPPATTNGGEVGATGGGRIGAGGTHTGDLATGPAIDVAVLGDRDRPAVTPGSGTGTGTGTGTGSGGSRGGPRTGAKPGSAAPDAATPGDLRSEIRRQSLAPAMSVAGTTAQARAAELSKVGFSTNAQAGAALYGLARTQHVELGQHAQALRTLDAYFKRFHKGAPEYEAALWLRLRLLCAGSFNDTCRAAAYSYVETFSTSTDATISARVAIAARVPLQ